MCLWLLATFVAGPAVAQDQTQQTTTTSGSISGNVHDPTGALVPGAAVTISNDHGFTRTVTTDAEGNYVANGLPPGTYKITVALKGFETLVIPATVVVAGQVQNADATLQVTGATASVNVVGQGAAQVETENAQLGGTITQKEVTAIGLNGRNFTQLITLAPGVSNQTGQDEALVGVKGSVKYSVNGGRVEYNNFDVDGSDVLNAGINGSQSTLIVYPSLDAIQQVQVLTSNYGAQYGRSASGTVLVTTKSGDQHFHGDIYEFARNELFNARGYFDISTRPPLYRRHDFGGTLGGPLYIPNHYNTKKDKTFFFYSEEARIEKTPTEFNQGVPSMEEREGYFGDACPYAPPGISVTFLRTNFPDCPRSVANAAFPYLNTFPGNQVPIDPNAELIMNSLIPPPTATTGCNSTIASCYDAAVSTPTNWREELARIDHNFTPNLKWTGRYIRDSWNTVTTIPQWGYIQNSFPTVENNFVGPGIDAVMHLDAILSPSIFNDFVFSFTTDEITLTELDGPGGSWQRPAGLVSCNPQAGITTNCIGALFNNGFGGKIPGIVVGGTNAAYGGNGFSVDPSFEPYHHSNPTLALGDNLTKTLGNHTLNAGVQAVFAQKNEINPAIGAATGDLQGIIGFSNENSIFTTGNAFADFLQGDIKNFQQDSSQAKYHNRYTTVEPYFQDDWHVTPRFILNLGLRFSLFGTYNEKYLKAYNWEDSAFSSSIASQAAVDPYVGALVQVSTCTEPQNPPALFVNNMCAPVPLNAQNPDPILINGQVQCGTDGIPRSCMNGHLFNPAPRIGFAWDPKGDNKTSIRAGYGIFFEHGTGNEANTGSLEGSAPLVLDITQRFSNATGYNCIGTGCIGGVTSPLAFPLNTTSIPTTAVWPYVQQWNFSIQRQLTPDLVTTAAYVGSKGTHLTAELQINQLHAVDDTQNPFPPGQPITTAVCGSFSGTSFNVPQNTIPPTSTAISAGEPGYINLEAACFGIAAGAAVPDPNSLRTFAPTFDQVFSLQNVANSNYNALQLTLRRAKAPLTVELAYSYSHSIDDSSDRFDSTLADAFDLRENRASSNFDQRQLLNISYVYDFSFIRLGHLVQNFWGGRKMRADVAAPSPSSDPPSFFTRLFDNWELSGVTTYQSGTPFTVINGGSASDGISVLDNAGVASGTGAGSYPDKLLNARFTDPLIAGASSAAFTFGPLLGDPNAFAAPEGLTFGDAGRNSLNNPSRLNFDTALLKHFKITESATLELRAEAFNFFNHTQFRIYDPDRGNNANNVVSCYGGPDNVAGFVGSGTNCLAGNSFLRPIDAHRPRTIQFGAKILF